MEFVWFNVSGTGRNWGSSVHRNVHKVSRRTTGSAHDPRRGRRGMRRRDLRRQAQLWAARVILFALLLAGLAAAIMLAGR